MPVMPMEAVVAVVSGVEVRGRESGGWRELLTSANKTRAFLKLSSNHWNKDGQENKIIISFKVC